MESDEPTNRAAFAVGNGDVPDPERMEQFLGEQERDVAAAAEKVAKRAARSA